MSFAAFPKISRAVWAAALVAGFCLALPSLGDASELEQGGKKRRGGPGFGGGISVGIPFEGPATRIEQPPRRSERACEPPLVLNRRNGRCVLPREERRPPRGELSDRPPPRQCGPGAVLSKKSGRCVCRNGFKFDDGACVKVAEPKPPKRVAECGAGEVFSDRREACVCRKGFDRVRGECVRPGKRQPPVIIVEPVPPRPRPPVVVVEPVPPPPPPPPAVGGEPAVEVTDSLPPRPREKPSRQALGPVIAAARQCLPSDLYDLIEAAYGKAPDVERCEAACLPKPEGYGEAELANINLKFGVEWCDSCIKLGGYLPLADIRKLEELTGATFCMADGARMCSAPGYARVDPVLTQVKIREIIRKLPVTLGKDGDIAVVIGNETYGNGIIENANGQSDADSIMTLLTEQLGYRKQNIIDLRNATLADLRRVFRGPDGAPGELANLYGGRDKGDVFVYVSSHGMRDDTEGKNYLLPVDAREDDLAATALSLDELYDSLGRIGAGTMLLALESSFSTRLSPFIDPPNLPESEAGVMPETPVPGLVVLTASDRDQRPLDDPEVGVGLFTRYLIEAMAGKADEGPIGNGDRRIDAVELFVYTADMVRTAARKTLGLEQKPQLSRVDNLLIGRLASR